MDPVVAGVGEAVVGSALGVAVGLGLAGGEVYAGVRLGVAAGLALLAGSVPDHGLVTRSTTMASVISRAAAAAAILRARVRDMTSL